MNEKIKRICQSKASFKNLLDALFSDKNFTEDFVAATYVMFKPSAQSEKFSLVMKHQLHPSYVGQKIYLENDDALNLMMSHNIPILKPKNYTPITLTYWTAFAIIFPILETVINDFAMTLTTPQGLAICLTALALYCLVIYPLLYSFLHWWNPESYIKFNTIDLIKEGAKLFSVIAVRLSVIAGTTLLGLSPLAIDIFSATAMTFFENLLASAEKNFSNWSLNPWAILSNISNFLLGAVHNALTTNITSFLKPLFLGVVGGVELMWILNFSYNMAYSFTFGKLILTSMGELQKYCLSKKEGIETYSFSSPLRQCLPTFMNIALDAVAGCVASTVTSVGKCLTYSGRTIVDCTNLDNIKECLKLSGCDSDETNQRAPLITKQPSSYGTLDGYDTHSISSRDSAYEYSRPPSPTSSV